MGLSKRTRYEVLRRDNHTCRYCGGTAPEVVLTVDHVVPVALGGSDKPDNLVAACRDCNAGKASTSPDADVVAAVSDDDLRWAHAIKRAGDVMVEVTNAERSRHAWFLEVWEGWDSRQVHLPDGWDAGLDCWLKAGLPQEVLLDCLHIAMGKKAVSHDGVFAYMGGVARRKVAELHEAARAMLDEEAADGA